MFGPSLRSVFRNRWMALLWSAMVIWTAVDFVGTGDAGATTNASANASANAADPLDAMGSPVTNEDLQTLRDFAEGN
jgi:hypothetical protein